MLYLAYMLCQELMLLDHFRERGKELGGMRLRRQIRTFCIAHTRTRTHASIYARTHVRARTHPRTHMRTRERAHRKRDIVERGGGGDSFDILPNRGIPYKALQFSAYIPGAIWTRRHLTETLAFKDHWPHTWSHDLAERRSQIPRTIGHMIYMT